MLPVSPDCLHPVSCVPNVTSFSGLSSSCVLCTQCYQFLWIVFILCLVYPMLPVSLDCLHPVSCVPNVTSFSGLSIPDLYHLLCYSIYFNFKSRFTSFVWRLLSLSKDFLVFSSMPIIYHARNSINDKVRSHYLCDKNRQTLFHFRFKRKYFIHYEWLLFGDVPSLGALK
jgi:hypothetical protein